MSCVCVMQDLGATGNFEITVDGQLVRATCSVGVDTPFLVCGVLCYVCQVHSKKTKGHGFLHDNPDQQEAVFAKVAERIRASKG